MITPQGTESGYDSNRIYETPESKLWRSVYLKALDGVNIKDDYVSEMASKAAGKAVRHYREGIVE